MPRTIFHTAALALSLGLFAGAAQASDVIDHSNSGSSATGSPFAYELATSIESFGASPMNDSNSASATGNPRAFSTPTSTASAAASPSDDSNSASALGGFGTGPRSTRPATLASLGR